MKKILPFLLIALVLSACSPSTPTPDLVGTQVSLILTSTALAQPIAPPTIVPLTLPAPTETATQLPSPTSTFTFTPSPTPAEDPKTSLGTPTWTSNLDNVSSWYTEDNDYANIRGENGTLALNSKQAIGWHSWTMHYHKVANFYLEGTIKVGACSGNDLYGIIFRGPTTSKGYFYTLTCDGRAGLRSFNGSEFTKLADFVQADGLSAGANQVNRLGILANGDNLKLFANGKKVLELTDSTFSEGTFGVFISAVNTPGFQIALDEISYWTLP